MDETPYLRPDLPRGYPFSVRTVPTVAKLDQNEAAVDLPAELKETLAQELLSRPWNRYIQPEEYAAAKATLAELVGVTPDRIAITHGGDGGLAAAAAIAGGPGRTIRWFEPTYPFIAHVARLSGGRCEAIALGPDLDTTLSAEHLGGDLLYLVSPNNPTGGLVSADLVRQAVAEPSRMVVVDEAYVDVSGVTVLSELADHDNLLVVRSLSKSLLAAMHVGFVVGSQAAVAAIERLSTAPYHLSGPQLLMCRHYTAIRPHVERLAADLVAERARVKAELESIAGVLRVLPSHGNFLAFEIAGQPAVVAGVLAERGIKVRDISGLPGMGAFLRITIGSRRDHDLALEALAAALRA